MAAYAIGHIRDLQMGPPIVEYLKRIDATLERVGRRPGPSRLEAPVAAPADSEHGDLRDHDGGRPCDGLRIRTRTRESFHGRFLVHGARPEVFEGQWVGDLVVIEFPDLERARAWYWSTPYREIAPLRIDNSNSEILLIDGVDRSHRATDILVSLAERSRTAEAVGVSATDHEPDGAPVRYEN
jgi:uncharacterized protein (DUF1330 family)